MCSDSYICERKHMFRHNQRGPSNVYVIRGGSRNSLKGACADPGGFFWSSETPPTAVCNFFLLVDLPRALQQFGSAPEIPVRTPPPSESWIRAWGGGGGVLGQNSSRGGLGSRSVGILIY